MKQILILLITTISMSHGFSQNVDLRRLTMKSDIILLVENTYERDSVEYPNDYTAKRYVTIRNIEDVIKNKYNDRLTNKRIRILTEGEEYYNDNGINCGGGTGCGAMLEYGKKYYQIYFIVKQKNEYVAIANLWWDFDWEKIVTTIKSILPIEQESDSPKRYSLLMDWFIENNQFPDIDFIEYYKQKGYIVKDDFQLTQAQGEQAKKRFLEGNEDMYQLIKFRYPQGIKEHLITKLIKIQQMENRKWNDYREFAKTYDKICDVANKPYLFYSPEETMVSELTNDERSTSEKEEMMRKLIENIPSTTQAPLKIIYHNISNEIRMNIRNGPWFNKDCGLYCKDASDIVYDQRTNQPFTGQIKLYRDTTWLVMELNLVDGQKAGWQTSYNSNGTVHTKYRYGEILPSMLSCCADYYESYEYYDNGQLKESYILENDTALLFRNTQYYLSGKKKSEGSVKFMEIVMGSGMSLAYPPKHKKRLAHSLKLKARKKSTFSTFMGCGSYKTGHWVYYNEEGSSASEIQYEIVRQNKYTIYEKQVGEKKNYDIKTVDPH